MNNGNKSSFEQVGFGHKRLTCFCFSPSGLRGNTFRHLGRRDFVSFHHGLNSLKLPLIRSLAETHPDDLFLDPGLGQCWHAFKNKATLYRSFSIAAYLKKRCTSLLEGLVPVVKESQKESPLISWVHHLKTQKPAVFGAFLQAWPNRRPLRRLKCAPDYYFFTWSLLLTRNKKWSMTPLFWVMVRLRVRRRLHAPRRRSPLGVLQIADHRLAHVHLPGWVESVVSSSVLVSFEFCGAFVLRQTQ